MTSPILCIGYEYEHAVDKTLVDTIEQVIHKKMDDLQSERFKPWCIILSKDAYLALCYVIANHWRGMCGNVLTDLEYYMDVIVVLDTTAVDEVRILRRPYEELAYPVIELASVLTA